MWYSSIFGSKPRTIRRVGDFSRLSIFPLEDRLAPALFVVNTLADTVDADADVTSLREAIQGANATPGADTINFSVAGTINTTGLSLTDSSGGTLIDGTTAPGYAGAPVVILDGPGTGGASRGLQLTTAGNSVRGLALGDFHLGIAVTGAGATNNTIAACYLGTDGSAALANNYGVVVNNGATGNQIGGTVAQRNLISGNLLDGIFINGAGTSGNLIQNNFIGTDATGTLNLGNAANGILVTASAANTRIEVNTIANNGSDGVRLDNTAGTGFALSLNSIFANAGLGINLVGGSDLPGGVTPNDAGDGDSGPNGLQNFPVLTSAVRSAANTLVAWSLNSTPNTAFALQFFSSPAADPSGFGEGRSLVGGVNITTDADGNFSDSILLAAVPIGNVITATATAVTALNTSEFSNAVAVTGSTTRTWDGGGSTNVWSDPLNWQADLAPAAGDLLVFGPGTPTTSVNDFAPGTLFSGLQFTGGDHTISGNQIDTGEGGTTVLAGSVTLDIDFHFDPICPPIVILPGSQLRLAGNLSGPGGIHKEGMGTLVLAGANTFDGPVHVEEGTLRLEHSLALGSASSGTELMDGILELQGGINVQGESLIVHPYIEQENLIRCVSGANTWTGTWHFDPICPPIVIEPGSTLRMTGVLSGAGGIHKDGTGILILAGANTFDGPVHVEEGTLRLEHSLALGSTAGGTELMDGVLELQGGINVQGESLIVHPYIEQENLIRSVSGANTWTGTWHFDPICPPIVIEPGSTLRMTGVLSGAGGIHKDGAGILILAGANTFDGPVHVEEGTLRLEHSLALGSTAGGTKLQGGNLELQGGITVANETLDIVDGTSNIRSVSGTNTWTGAWNIEPTSAPAIEPAGVPIVVEAGSTFAASGVLSGVGGLHKDGLGTFILSGANTYLGETRVAEGTLSVRSNTALGSTAGGTELQGGNLELQGGITVANETLDIVDGTSNIRSVSGANAWTGAWAIEPTSVPNIEPTSIPIVVEAGSTFAATGVLSGVGGLHKDGLGTFILSGANTYLGETRVAEGTLSVRSNTALGSTAGGTKLQGGNLELQGGITVANETLEIVDGTSNIRSVSGANTWTGAWVIEPTSTPGIEPAGVPIMVEAGSTFAATGVLSGVGGLHKDGLGTFVLSGANTYLGETRVAEGTLSVRSATALGSTAGGTKLQGGNLELQGGITVANETLDIVDGTSNIRSVSGANTWTGAWNIEPTSSPIIEPTSIPIVVEAGSTFAATGVISGVGGLHKDGLGTFVLSGANTYRGETRVAEGTLSVRSNTALGSTAGITELMGGTLELRGGITVGGETLAMDEGTLLKSVSGSNTWTGAIALLRDPPFEVEAGSVLTLSGVISGSEDVQKTGEGTLILTADNTLTGTITLLTGNLQVDGSQPASPIVVAGGVLTGTGVLGPITLTGGLIQGSVVQASPFDATKRDLVIGGTTNADSIELSPAPNGGVAAVLNGASLGTYSPTGRLIVYAGAGDDIVQVAGSLGLPAWLYGDAGNDRLNGGAGGNVLLGGAGSDFLLGGSGRDLMIGGTDADQIVGNGGDDLMIGGATAFDGNVAALRAIAAEWTSTHDFATRIANLSGISSSPGFASRLNGDYFLIPFHSVFVDGAVDTLKGSSGFDWYIVDSLDEVNGATGSDRVTRFGP